MASHCFQPLFSVFILSLVYGKIIENRLEKKNRKYTLYFRKDVCGVIKYYLDRRYKSEEKNLREKKRKLRWEIEKENVDEEAAS